MSTTTDTYAAVAGQARKATEKGAEIFKQGAKTFTENTDVALGLPKIDLAQPVERYFEYLQRAIDTNRELAIKWATALNSMTGVVRGQAETFGSIVRDQVESATDLATETVDKAESAAKEQAAKVEEAAKEQAAKIEEAEKEVARKARAAEREEAKKAHEKAREPYEGLTKAELSEKLAERDLPKSGNVDELIERLVEADAK